ncbi:MAG: cytochrome c-type biogenesis protein CcmH [Alphaproteobacteria bacterium]|jgi:cytochrome c-type biogenesis protein CcmH|nr:cytochrome c-type biogenesis protein CcmH [Alphaproteobacteria bacterium]
MLIPFLRHLITVFFVLGLAGSAGSAGAVAVDRPMDDPALEARARAIHKQLRCLVCQNQSIEDSNASLARDLRILVRDRIAMGDSDDATIRYIVERYGDWVLLRPPVKAGTILLWLGPVLFLALAVMLIIVWYRRQKAPIAAINTPLDEVEQARLKAIMGNEDRV